MSIKPVTQNIATNHFKIAVHGARGAGKKTLFQVANDHHFKIYLEEIPTDFSSSSMARAFLRIEDWSAEIVVIPDDKNIDDERRKQLLGCDVILILISIDDRQSLSHIGELKAEATQLCGSKAVCFVGISKQDLKDSVKEPITKDEALAKAKEHGVTHVVEIAAKDETALQLAMERIAESVADRGNHTIDSNRAPRCNIL